MPFDIKALGLSPEQETKIEDEFNTRNEAVRRVNSELKTEKSEIKDRLDAATAKLAGMTDQSAVLETQSARIKELEENDSLDVETLTTKITAKVTSEMAEKYETAQAQNQALIDENAAITLSAGQSQQALEREVRDGGIVSAMLLLKADPQAGRAAKILARETVQVTNDEGKTSTKPVIEVDTTGKVVFRSFEDGKVLSDEKGTFGFQDWVNYLHDKEHLTIFKDAQGSGSRGGSIKKEGVYKSTMTAKEKSAYKEAHGYAAYNDLPFSAPAK